MIIELVSILAVGASLVSLLGEFANSSFSKKVKLELSVNERPLSVNLDPNVRASNAH